MSEVTLARYLAAALSTPLAIPFVLLLIPHWRYSDKTIRRLALGAEIAICLFIWLCQAVWGLTPTTVWLVGTLPPAICLAIFAHCCAIWDGRLFFLLVTTVLNYTVNDILITMMADRNTMIWCIWKCVISLIQTVLMVRFCRAPLLEMLDNTRIHWGVMTILPLSLLACLLGYYTIPVMVLHGTASVPPTLLLCITVLLVYGALYLLQRASRQHAEAQQHSALLRREVDALTRQVRQREQAEERIRILRHDIRHYIRLFRVALDRAESDTAQELLAQLEREAAVPIDSSVTGSVTLDLVIAQTTELAQQAGVNFHSGLNLPHPLRVDLTELAVALSNALENAVQVAAREPNSESRWVSLQNQSNLDQQMLVISNPCSSPVRFDKRTGLPRAGQPGHGYGTLSIAMFAQKYNCLIDCSLKDGIFSLRLLI